MKSLLVSVVAVLALGVLGCQSRDLPPVEPFRIFEATNGQVYRLNTISGEIHVLSTKSLHFVAMHERVPLEIGRVYEREDGEAVVYQGKLMFDLQKDAQRKKYGLVPKAP